MMPALKRDFMPEDLGREMERAGVDRSIAVRPADARRDALAARAPTPIRSSPASSVGRPAVSRSMRSSNPASHLAADRRRHVVQAEPDGFLGSDAFRRGILRLDRYGLTYDISRSRPPASGGGVRPLFRSEVRAGSPRCRT
jgi:L-fuconolactonase